MISSLQEELVNLISRPCVISTDSPCLYFVSDCGAVYEAGMINTQRRFLKEMLPNGRYAGALYVIGAIFCSDH